MTSFKDVIRIVPLEFSFDCALAGNAMHIIYRAFFVVLCATFSAPIHADDFVSVVDQNFPYDEVDESYGVAKIQEGRCQEGTPFQIVQDDSSTDTKMDVAKRIHEILRSMGANAFLITDLEEDTHVRNVMVTPLTCDLN